MTAEDHLLSPLPFPLCNIVIFTCFDNGFIFRHYKITIITFKNLFFVKVQHCFVLKYEVAVTVHTAGRDEEHADEDVLQNNSL